MDLSHSIQQAFEKRAEFLAEAHRQDTDSYRLFHGIAEGFPGLTLDRYGPILLTQTFRAPLSDEETRELENVSLRLATQLGSGEFFFVYNHRGEESRERSFDDWHRPFPAALNPKVFRESGIKYWIKARHRGKDPLLFLDLRAARRFALQNSRGLSFLNLFAYTCGVGLCAATGGAKEVWNVDFAQSCLDVGRENACLNGLDGPDFRFVREDVIACLHQLGGIPLKGRRARRAIETKLSPRTFDLVFLDPPAWSAGPYGAVDLVRDYQSLFKPCLFVVPPGGKIVAVNNVAKVKMDEWLDILVRCAKKAGRPIQEIQVIKPDPDFPSWDEQHPLKVAVCTV